MGVLYVIGKVCIFAAGAAGKAAGVEEAPACFGHLWTTGWEWSEFRLIRDLPWQAAP